MNKKNKARKLVSAIPAMIPLIVLILIFIVGVLTIYKIQDKKELEERFFSQKIIDLPQFSLQNLFDDNDSLTNSDFTEKEYYLLNVFASWCTSCRAEHDILLKISNNKNINIYGIAFKDIDENTKQYLAYNKNPYKKVGIDRRGELSDLLFVKGVPETFLINKKSQIIYHHQGGLDQEFISLINKLTVVK